MSCFRGSQELILPLIISNSQPISTEQGRHLLPIHFLPFSILNRNITIMTFHPSFRIGAIFAFLLSIALLGDLGGPSTSLHLVSAEELQCGVILEFSTWQDKDIPRKDLPVPDTDVYPDELVKLITKQFEKNVGQEYWVTQNVFKAYELRNVDSDFSNSNNVSSTTALEDPSTRRSLFTQNWNLPVEERVQQYSNSFVDIHVDFCRHCKNDDDTDDGPLNQAKRYKREYLARKREEEREKKKREEQREKEEARKGYLQVSQGMYDMIYQDLGHCTAPSGFCNEKYDDDDDDGYEKFTLSESHRKHIDNLRKWKKRKPRRKSRRKLTVDHFNQGFTDGDVILDSLPSHEAFERDVCNALRNLGELFPLFETSEGCKIAFHCRDVDEGEGQEKNEDESKGQLAVYDTRDFDASELDQYGEELPLYRIMVN